MLNFLGHVCVLLGVGGAQSSDMGDRSIVRRTWASTAASICHLASTHTHSKRGHDVGFGPLAGVSCIQQLELNSAEEW